MAWATMARDASAIPGVSKHMTQHAEPLSGVGGFYADNSLAEIRLAAAFRRGFRQALVLIRQALAEHDLSELQYHLLLEAGSSGEAGIVQGDLAELL